MIFVIASEKDVAEDVKNALEPMGYEIATFDSGESALDLFPTLDEPELIISETELSGMDGYEFKSAYNRAFPNSRVPFIYYSAHDDDASIMRGLDLGVDDYLQRPLSAALLAARIRSVLRRRQHYLIHTFYGDLGKLPFFKLIQFCEQRGLTGEVEIDSPDMNVIISFRAGQLLTDETNDEVLLQIYDLKEGIFIIRAMPMNYTDILQFAVQEIQEEKAEPAQVYAEQEKPMGKLSGIQAGKRLFQFQTEFVTEPSNQLVTIVVLDGRVMTKKINPITGEKRSKRELERLIEEQHIMVEGEIREKMASLAEKKKTELEDTMARVTAATEEEEVSPQVKFGKLFAMGFEKYRNEDYEGALTAWEEAYSINPTDKSLETNIRILKKKLKL